MMQGDLSKINTFILDVDGVLTDGTVLSMASGEQVRTFLVKDGFAIEAALKQGYIVAIISGGMQAGVLSRLSFLGIKEIYLGVKNKVEVYEQLKQKLQIQDSEIAYMGDDLPDYDVMLQAGLASCPADAAAEIIEISKFVSNFGGGKGAVRDLIETVMKFQNKWFVSNQKANG